VSFTAGWLIRPDVDAASVNKLLEGPSATGAVGRYFGGAVTQSLSSACQAIEVGVRSGPAVSVVTNRKRRNISDWMGL
jgi:hypothetical protein